jgi:hypothetical protein
MPTSSGRRRQHGAPRAAAAIAAVFVATAVALTASTAGRADGIELEAQGGTGIVLSNSKGEGQAILVVGAIRPGTTATGTVTITNTGDTGGILTLSKGDVVDTPGPNGGRLSDVLDLVVSETTGAPAVVYAGRASAMGPVQLGAMPAGAARTFAFAVTLPDGGIPASATSGDNLFLGSQLTVRYDWTAVEPPAATPPPPATQPPAATPPAPAPTPPDVEPPRTAIVEGPPPNTKATTATFRFVTSEAGSTFECSLDGEAFAACVPPKDYTALAPGPHTFAVRARDPARNADPNPATRAWTIAAAGPTDRLVLSASAEVGRAAIALRVQLSRKATVQVRLVTARGAIVRRWQTRRPAGVSSMKLPLAPSIRPGRYGLVVEATAARQSVEKRLSVTLPRTTARR